MAWYQGTLDMTWCYFGEDEVIEELLEDGWEPYAINGDIHLFRRLTGVNCKRKDYTKRLGRRYV